MDSSEEKYSACFQAIEKELERRGLDFTIHGLPGADDIIHFEEYWLTNLPEQTKLFPAIVDADQASGLDQMIVRAVKTHEAQHDATAYYVVLCGTGWTGEWVESLRQRVAAKVDTGIRLTIETLASFSPGR